MGHVDNTIPRIAEDCGFECAFRDAPVKWPTPVEWIANNKTAPFHRAVSGVNTISAVASEDPVLYKAAKKRNRKHEEIFLSKRKRTSSTTAIC